MPWEYPKLEAPWSGDTVEALSHMQTHGTDHPYTCAGGGGPCRGENVILYPTTARWLCPKCGFRQTWFYGSRRKVA